MSFQGGKLLQKRGIPCEKPWRNKHKLCVPLLNTLLMLWLIFTHSCMVNISIFILQMWKLTFERKLSH